jgi:hydrophobic/amphiphilic exporter-1 (mainly G- bacteria), HAE1 family
MAGPWSDYLVDRSCNCPRCISGALVALASHSDDCVAFIWGAVPLAIASGAGAKSRQVLGTAVIGGMTTGSLLAIFLIPVSFYVVERLFRRKKVSPAPQGVELPVMRVAD